MIEDLDFLFLIEHEDREMMSVKKVVEKIVQQGYSVVVLSIEFHAHLMLRYAPRCVVFPYASDSDRWPISYFKRRFGVGVSYISLAWEQLLSDANKEFKKPKDEFVKESIYHLAWSEDYKRYLTDSGVIAKNVKVLGNPSHELMFEAQFNRENLRLEIYRKFDIDSCRELIFFPMNYGWAFASDRMIEAKIRMGYEESVAWEYRDYSRACLEEFVGFATELSQDTRFKIVIRPHPSISVEQYLGVFRKLATSDFGEILFTKDLTIIEWITVADYVGSSWSTSVWDAVNIGKKGFLFTPIPRPPWLETFWNNKVCNIGSSLDFYLADKMILDHVSDISKISIDISTWLIKSISTKVPVTQGRFITAKELGYFSRSFYRSLSMEFFSGRGVPSGMRRDFFRKLEFNKVVFDDSN